MSTIWCLHGNLQQPIVWDDLVLAVQIEPLRPNIISLWDTLADDFWGWADTFCQTVRASGNHSQHYLLGYSLGGRLALHALVRAPDLWSGALIVSADPGTVDVQVRSRCLSRDRIWANRFLTEPWDDLLAEWDSLPVFCGRPCTIPRPESDFDRHKIAHAFEAYSKGHMDDLTPRLRQLTIPITYITGSDDKRYSHIGRTLATQCPTITHIEVQDAGHRVPWEQPEAFQNLLIKLLST